MKKVVKRTKINIQAIKTIEVDVQFNLSFIRTEHYRLGIENIDIENWKIENGYLIIEEVKDEG